MLYGEVQNDTRQFKGRLGLNRNSASGLKSVCQVGASCEASQQGFSLGGRHFLSLVNHWLGLTVVKKLLSMRKYGSSPETNSSPSLSSTMSSGHQLRPVACVGGPQCQRTLIIGYEVALARLTR